MTYTSLLRYGILVSSLIYSNIALATPPSKANEAKAVSFVAADSLGKKIDLGQYAGKTVLLSFYSVGCKMCGRDLKLMREFYRDNASKNFVILGVSLEKTKAEFDMYSKMVALSIPSNQQFPLIWKGNVHATEDLSNISNDPTHIVIDPNGQIILKREGSFKPEDWDNLWESIAR